MEPGRGAEVEVEEGDPAIVSDEDEDVNEDEDENEDEDDGGAADMCADRLTCIGPDGCSRRETGASMGMDGPDGAKG